VQAYYQPGPRPQQPRGISHRGGQGTSGTPVVGMAGVGGGGGQPPAIYPHPASLQAGMFVPGHNLHAGPPHQPPVYPMNSQVPLQVPKFLFFIFIYLMSHNFFIPYGKFS